MSKYINKSSIIEVDWRYGPYYEIKINPWELYKFKDSDWDVYLRMYKRKEISNEWKTDYLVINENWKDFFDNYEEEQEEEEYYENNDQNNNNDWYESYNERLESNDIPECNM